MIVSLGSIRGAPGVTSWTMLLAAAWPRDERRLQRVVLEADPDGGVLAARYGVGVDPGAITFAASLRRGGGPVLDVGEHSRVIDERVQLLPGPEGSDRAAAVWRDAAYTTAEAISGNAPFDWFVDCGRFRPGTPSLEFARLASLTVVLVGPSTEDLLQLPSTLQMLASEKCLVAVVVVGRPAHDLDEVKEFLGTDHVFAAPGSRNLPAETAAVINTSRARRGWLWRGAVNLASQLEMVVPRPVPLMEVGAP